MKTYRYVEPIITKVFAFPFQYLNVDIITESIALASVI